MSTEREALRQLREPVLGTPLDLKVGMVVRRTEQPLPRLVSHTAPVGHRFLITYVGVANPHYDDLDEHRAGSFPARYATDVFFAVVAQTRPTAPLVTEWLARLREQITDRPIVREDLAPGMAEFGISVPDEVADYWLQHLNDRMVDLDTLASYLGRLADLFISPAYAITGPLERLRAMPEGELRAFLHDSSSHWWRRILVGIGLVLRHREQFSPAAVQAAHEALQVWPPR